MSNLSADWQPMTRSQVQTVVAGFVLSLLNNENEEHVRAALAEVLQQWPELLKFRSAQRRFIHQQVTSAMLDLFREPKKPTPS